MKALLINLPKSKDRLNFQKQQLKQLGINFEVIEATGINDITESEYRRLSGAWQRLMRRTEVACFMSHLKTWNMVLELNQPCLILEDDAYLSSCVPSLLSEFNSFKECDLITLENRSRKKIVSKKKQDISCDCHLLELYQDRTGAAGYVLWPSGAQKLIDKYNKGRIGLADAFISSCYTIKAFQIEPAAIVQLDQCTNYQLSCTSQTESIITPMATTHPQADTVAKHLLFRLKRVLGQVRMGLRQLAVLHKSERRYIRINPENFTEL